MSSIDLTILILCLNEEKSIAHCVADARRFLERSAIKGEVLVLDNGSEDRSKAHAQQAGARVVVEERRGYGSTILAGIDAARSRYVILGDGDGEHDLNALEPFWDKLREGYDLVVGNRFATPSVHGGMRFWNRYVGAPLLSGIGRLFFRSPLRDFHCGLRGFDLMRIRDLNLQALGMESASEMIIKATRKGLRVAEVPISQRQALDADRVPRLRIWRDGWRHLRLLLLLAPNWLFLRPGIVAVAVGTVFLLLPWVRPDWLGTFAMLYGAAMVVCGTQLASFAGVTTLFSERMGFIDSDWTDWVLRHRVLTYSIATSLVLATAGLAGNIWSLMLWAASSHDATAVEQRIAVAVPSVTALMLAMQVLSTGFLLAFLTMRENK